MLSGSSGSVTSVWVCEPRQSCTPGSWTGLSMSLMSKMRTPRNRSGFTGAGAALRAAVDATAGLLDRDEQQVPVHRRVTLAAGADERPAQDRVGRVADVVDLEAVETAHDRVVAGERQVRVGDPNGREPRGQGVEAGGTRGSLSSRSMLLLASVHGMYPGVEADPRVCALGGGRRGEQAAEQEHGPDDRDDAASHAMCASGKCWLHGHGLSTSEVPTSPPGRCSGYAARTLRWRTDPTGQQRRGP